MGDPWREWKGQPEAESDEPISVTAHRQSDVPASGITPIVSSGSDRKTTLMPT